MPTTLPQHDPHPKQRARRLARRQRQVSYCYTHVAPLAISEDVPEHHAPRGAWWLEVLKVADAVLENTQALGEARGQKGTHRIRQRREAMKVMGGLGVGLDPAEDDGDDDGGLLDRLKARVRPRDRVAQLLGTPWQKVISDAADELAVNMVSGRAGALGDFLSLFRTLPPTEQQRGVVDDHEFAWMRVAGPNPLVLRRVRQLPERAPGQRAAVAAAMARAGHPAEVALAQGRVYICDYADLAGMEPGQFPVRKVVLWPLAVFVLPPQQRRLVPVAIQCVQAPNQPVFTPQDGWAWQAAKLTVQVADGNHHEAVSHLGRTHLRVEPFVVATERQLDREHPIYKLLRPHFEGTLFINNSAHSALIAPNGTVDRLMSGSIAASRAAAVQGLQAQPFETCGLPEDLAARDVDDPALEYPYRDDARLIWAALERWITAYVERTYPTPAALRSDTELQAWAAELASPDGGRVAGFGQPPGQILSRDWLAGALTGLIFTASAQHAAVNFPQNDTMANAGNFPLGLYAGPPRPGMSEAEFLEMLPPLDQGLIQLNLGTLLGQVHFTELGRYDKDTFDDPGLGPLLAQLHKGLDAAARTIAERNTARLRPYPYLLPKNIPQSINI